MTHDTQASPRLPGLGSGDDGGGPDEAEGGHGGQAGGDRAQRRHDAQPGAGDAPVAGGDLGFMAAGTSRAASMAGPEILIEIDPILSGGFTRDRFEVTIGGRITSPAAIAEVRLQIDENEVVGSAAYGLPDRAMPVIMPNGTRARQRVFQLNLPRPANIDGERCTFQVVARTHDDLECAEDFAVDIAPDAAAPVTLVAGPAHGTPSAGLIRPQTILHVERGTIDADGTLTVGGWAVATAPILAVQVCADNRPVGDARLGLRRDDVAGAFSPYPNSDLAGFALTMVLPPAEREAVLIRVRMVCADGVGHQQAIPVERLRRQGRGVAAEPPVQAGPSRPGRPSATPAAAIVPSPPAASAASPDVVLSDMVPSGAAPSREQPVLGDAGEIHVFCDEARLGSDGMLSLNGWAFFASGIIQIRVGVDGRDVGLATPGHERRDVSLIFPEVPMARFSGFKFDANVGDHFSGLHTVQIVVCGTTGRERQISTQVAVTAPAALRPPLAGALPVAASREAPEAASDQPAEFKMELDAPVIANGIAVETVTGRLTIDGWLLCRSGIEKFDVYLGDRRLGGAHYGLARQDVGAAFPDWPNALRAGFAFHCPPRSLRDGTHAVRLAIQARNGACLERRFSIVVKKAEDQRDQAGLRRRVPRVEADMTMAHLRALNGAPSFRFVLRPAPAGGAEPTTAAANEPSASRGDGPWRPTQDAARREPGAAPALPVPESGARSNPDIAAAHDGAEHAAGTATSATRGTAFAAEHDAPRPTSGDAGRATDTAAMPATSGGASGSINADVVGAMDAAGTAGSEAGTDAIDTDALRVTLNALRLQSYDDWTVLALADDPASAHAMQVAIGDILPHMAERFGVITPADERWTQPLAETGGKGSTLIGLLHPGDQVGADMLLELALAAARHPTAGLIYGDEIRRSPISGELEPFFKPDFSPDLLLATNYIGRPWVATAETVAGLGVTPADVQRRGEYDLVLRCAEQAETIQHVRKLLCQRAQAILDEAAPERLALTGALLRRDVQAAVLPTPIPGTWRVKRPIGRRRMVSIIIPTCAANGHVETCIRSLRERSTYRDFEIIVVDNVPPSKPEWKSWLRTHADKVIDIPAAFNWSLFNNRAAEAAAGDYLLFLNDDIDIIDGDWLQAMLEHAQRPEVGIVGPQLLYGDDTVQHAGMFLASAGIGRHAFRFAAKDDPCYFGLALTQRNVIAVTGACMLMRREVFDRLGGFAEAHQIVNNDLDFCLRAHRAGLLTVFTPYASLRHYELASRAYLKDVFDPGQFDAAWKTVFAAGDPYFSPRLSKHADDYRWDDEPVQSVVSGAPLFRKDEIRRILVVKLDHIGDFVTALPPIRRLKAVFPHARITVLAGQASRAFVPLEPAIDELITFDFYHARSQLGERALSGGDYALLAERLKPCCFDLAVDLRKHTSTRDVLKHSGARFLAGFDHLGQYPDLDIALDWDGDRSLQRKRSHIVDDLLALVGAIERATETDRAVLGAAPVPTPLAELPEKVQVLFARPVVAIHPGAGNVTKQWPEEHFSALIDLLIERNDVNVMLVGGPDEADLAERLAGGVLRADRVASAAGETTLAGLPGLLARCSLYIGNDSGPKHVAAAVGVPTVGIHSGVVDPVEWGPLGPHAVALRRNMTCSPCYLANAEDCPRSLACLRFLEPGLVHEAADRLLQLSMLSTARKSGAASAFAVAAGAAIAQVPTDRKASDMTHAA